MKNKIEAVIFDFDGVIAYTEEIHLKTFREVLAPFGISIDSKRWYTEFVGIGGRNIMDILLKENKLEKNLEELVEKRSNNFIEYIEKNQIEEVPGIEKFVEKLHSMKMKKAIASGSRRRVIETITKRMGLINYFDTIIGAEDTQKKKPHPEPFLLAAERIKIKPENCLVLEDSPNGFQAAKSAGIPCVCVKNPYWKELNGCLRTIDNYKNFPMEIFE